MELAILFILNIVFVGALWHMDVHHSLEKQGQARTGGCFG